MWLLLLALLVVAALVPWASNRWRFRHIPGPFALPFVGNLPSVVRVGMHNYLLECSREYGKVFKVYLGSQMMVVVSDPRAAHRLNYRMINRSVNQLRLNDEDREMSTSGLVLARGERWRTLRLAWQPAFQSSSLERFAGLMDRSAEQLAERLREAGRAGAVVDMWRELGRMTLDVVGTTAYGVDFHTLPHGAAADSDVARGQELISACQTVFAASGLAKGSVWILLSTIVPAPALVSWGARTFPDGRLKELLGARRVIRAVSGDLIRRWRSERPAERAGPAAAAAAAAAAGGDPAEAPLVEVIPATVPAAPPAADAGAAGAARDQSAKAPAAAKAGGGGGGGARPGGSLGVAPGSFMGLMLEARDKGSGQPLPDPVVVAQSNTFILAGYETTANTLSFCVAAIGASPRVQARLLAEVDAFGRDRRLAYADLGQFPYAEAVVREALRLFPPATLTSREIKEGGFNITPELFVPAGTPVFSFLYGYQRDPEIWPRAEEFLPERWLPEGAEHLAPTTMDAWTPFGAGSRMCVGWRFALQEAKIALVRLYQHQTYQLEPGQVPLALQQNITLSPKHGVHVRVVPRE